MKNCRGFSVVELMVSCVINLMIVASMLSLYFSVKRVYTIEHSHVAWREAAFLIHESMRFAIFHAGFGGCRPLGQLLTGYHVVEIQHQLSKQSNLHLREGSDILVLKGLEVERIPDGRLDPKASVVIADCQKAMVLPASRAAKLSQYLPLTRCFVGRLYEDKIFIAHSKAHESWGLYIKRNHDVALRIISGVERMHVQVIFTAQNKFIVLFHFLVVGESVYRTSRFYNFMGKRYLGELNKYYHEIEFKVVCRNC
jgi:hypothetical protein